MTASAKTQSWAEAEKAKRSVEAEFGKGNVSESVQVEADARITLIDAKERFLTSKRHGEGVGEAVVKKYEREIDRLLATRHKFFLNEITTDDMKALQAGWASCIPQSRPVVVY